MIQIKSIDFIPDIAYGEYARKELEAGGNNAIRLMQRQSQNIFVGFNEERPLFTAGIVQRTLTSPPALWFLLCEDITLRHIRGLRELSRIMDQWPGLQTTVENDWWTGLKFAQFFGFRPRERLATHLILER